MNSNRKDPIKLGLATDIKITPSKAEMKAIRAKATAGAKLRPAVETGIAATFKNLVKKNLFGKTPTESARERDARAEATRQSALEKVKTRTRLNLSKKL